MPKDHFTVATYNVNSLRTRQPIVLDWLERQAPDVFCLQETKVQDKDFPAAPLLDAGYHVVFCGQKVHAGVAIVSRQEPEDVSFGFDGAGEEDGPRLIRARIAGITVVNTYVPQGRALDSEQFPYKLAWLARLRELFERDHNPEKPLVWMGDFNVAPEPIDVHAPERLQDHVCFHADVRAALEHVRTWGLDDVFRRHHPDEPGQYTYYDYRARDPIERGIGWRVDHIWATPPLAQRSVDAWIDLAPRRAERPSDHTVLAARFSLS